MSQHDPNINWNSGEILQWCESWFHECLSPVVKPSTRRACLRTADSSPCVHLNSNSIESPEIESKIEIPPEYRAFQMSSVSGWRTQLPPHRPWDCGIDLLPVATLSKAKVYPLSVPEQKAKEEYIEEALKQEFIHPSINFPCHFKFLLCWEKGRRLAARH